MDFGLVGLEDSDLPIRLDGGSFFNRASHGSIVGSSLRDQSSIAVVSKAIEVLLEHLYMKYVGDSVSVSSRREEGKFSARLSVY